MRTSCPDGQVISPSVTISAMPRSLGRAGPGPAEIGRQLLDQLRSTVELGRRVVVQRDPPPPVAPYSGQPLHRVERRHQIVRAGRDDAGDRTEYRHVRGELDDLAHDADVGARA